MALAILFRLLILVILLGWHFILAIPMGVGPDDAAWAHGHMAAWPHGGID
jgi:hypothetical protein